METIIQLETYLVKGGIKTPHVELNPNGRFKLSGVSTPLDAAEFYYDILDWLTDYFRDPAENTNILIEFSHINSSSSSMLYRVFHLLNRLQETNKSRVRCVWAYDVEDEFMIEFIESIKEMATGIMFITEPKSIEFEI
ncbi:MAG: SiaC family regulatory phosphoprotein [Crocinitomicaceae bacterium]